MRCRVLAPRVSRPLGVFSTPCPPCAVPSLRRAGPAPCRPPFWGASDGTTLDQLVPPRMRRALVPFTLGRFRGLVTLARSFIAATGPWMESMARPHLASLVCAVLVGVACTACVPARVSEVADGSVPSQEERAIAGVRLFLQVDAPDADFRVRQGDGFEEDEWLVLYTWSPAFPGGHTLFHVRGDEIVRVIPGR